MTGSAGFIGRHLITQLADLGHTVFGLDRRAQAASHNVSFFEVDLLDYEATRQVFEECRPDVVVHLAARTDLGETKDISGYRDNIEAVQHLVDAMRTQPSVRRWICTSSQLVCRIGYVPIDDKDYRPDTLYGESKVWTERICRSSDGSGMTWTIARPTTIWGPGMNPHYLRFFEMIRDGRYFHVGSSPLTKSYGYVRNTVLQFAKLATVPAELVHQKTFYLADYQPLELRAWAEGFRAALSAPPIHEMPIWGARLLGKVGDALEKSVWRNFPFTSFRLRNILTEYQLDLSPTAAVCGPLPYSTENGVLETTAWLRHVWGHPVHAAAVSKE